MPDSPGSRAWNAQPVRPRCRRRRGITERRRVRLRPTEDVNDASARLWHPWLRINRVLRVMLQTRWSAEAWSQVRVEFKRALALRSGIRRAVRLAARETVEGS